jgi:Flp pilus assembly protein CpaB
VQFAQKLLSTRGGTIVLSLAAAALAAVILITYLHRYRESVRESNVNVSVLVAKGVISKGTSGDIIATQGLYQVSDRARGDVVDGAITDPATLKGRVATEDIYPGEQLTAAKLGVSTSTSLANRISGDERAVTLPIDSAHGMIGQLEAGDHVDVYAGFNVQQFRLNGGFQEEGPERPVLKLISADVLVLAVPTSGSGGIGGGSGKTRLVVRMTDKQAADAAFAADNGILWAVLRPRANADAPSPSIVSVETLLFGVPPLKVYKSLGGQ